MRHHSQSFEQLPQEDKDTLNLEAEEHREKKEQQVLRDIAVQHEVAVLHHASKEADRVKDADTLKAQNMRFTDEEKSILEATWQSSNYSQRTVQALRREAIQPPGPMDPGLLKLLHKFQVDPDAQFKCARPQLIFDICRRASAFKSCVLVFGDETEERRYLLVGHISGNPYTIDFSDLDLKQVVLDEKCLGGRHVFDWMADNHNYEWTRRWTVHVHEFSCPQDTPMDVITNVNFDLGGGVWSDSTCAYWDDYIAANPAQEKAEKASKETARTHRGPTKGELDTFRKCPWLEDWIGRQAEKRATGSKHGSRRPPEKNDKLKPDGSDEEDSDSTFLEEDIDIAEALVEFRKRLADAGPLKKGKGDFVFAGRGGDDTKQRKGVAYDCVRGEQKNIHAENFVVNYRMPKSFDCYMSKIDEEWCTRLVAEWIRKAQFLYDIWCVEGKKIHRWKFPEDVAATFDYDDMLVE